MNYKELFDKWCGLNNHGRVWIVTDNVQMPLAQEIAWDTAGEVRIFSNNAELLDELKSLSSDDLLIALFSINTFLFQEANESFSPFGKPDWLAAKYTFIRLDISGESLKQGLSTTKEDVYSKIAEMERFTSGQTIHVTNAAGTDIVMQIHPFTTCSHEVTEKDSHAFLPPSETSSDVCTETANGTIVVDVTVGQLYHYGSLHGYFGMVPSPVTITVDHGIITDITGNDMAEELKQKLFALPADCRRIVEIGQGLSDMTPTGLIGVDECIRSTCHFGFGDGSSCGTHLDVVIDRPTIKAIE